MIRKCFILFSVGLSWAASAPLDASVVDLSAKTISEGDADASNNQPREEKPVVTKARSRGHAGNGLVWVVPDPKGGADYQFDISNSFIGGLKLRPDGSDSFLWFDHTRNFSYEPIKEYQYLKLNQPKRKAVLYGRLLHFGAYQASQSIGTDISTISLAMLRDAQSEIDVALIARDRANRISKGVLVGAIGMFAGYDLAYLGLIQRSCSTDLNSMYSYETCEMKPNMALIGVGSVIFLASAIYMGYKLALPSAEELEAKKRLEAIIANLNEETPMEDPSSSKWNSSPSKW